MSNLKVKKKLKKAFIGFEDCYKVFNEINKENIVNKMTLSQLNGDFMDNTISSNHSKDNMDNTLYSNRSKDNMNNTLYSNRSKDKMDNTISSIRSKDNIDNTISSAHYRDNMDNTISSNHCRDYMDNAVFSNRAEQSLSYNKDIMDNAITSSNQSEKDSILPNSLPPSPKNPQSLVEQCMNFCNKKEVIVNDEVFVLANEQKCANRKKCITSEKIDILEENMGRCLKLSEDASVQVSPTKSDVACQTTSCEYPSLAISQLLNQLIVLFKNKSLNSRFSSCSKIQSDSFLKSSVLAPGLSSYLSDDFIKFLDLQNFNDDCCKDISYRLSDHYNDEMFTFSSSVSDTSDFNEAHSKEPVKNTLQVENDAASGNFTLKNNDHTSHHSVNNRPSKIGRTSVSNVNLTDMFEKDSNLCIKETTSKPKKKNNSCAVPVLNLSSDGDLSFEFEEKNIGQISPEVSKKNFISRTNEKDFNVESRTLKNGGSDLSPNSFSEVDLSFDLPAIKIEKTPKTCVGKRRSLLPRRTNRPYLTAPKKKIDKSNKKTKVGPIQYPSEDLNESVEQLSLNGLVKEKSSVQPYSFLKSLSPGIKENLQHPDARKFVLRFQSTKEELANVLFDLYNEKIFNGKVTLTTPILWNSNLTKTAGLCHTMYNEKRERTFRIELSVKVCSTPDRVRDTLVHEMCHAVVWLSYGIRDGHELKWQRWARIANLLFKDLPPVTRCHTYVIATKYLYICTKCGYQIGRHSKSLDTSRKVCGRCRGTFKLLNKNENGSSV